MNVDKAGREGEPSARYAFERIALVKIADQSDSSVDDRHIGNVRAVP